MCPGLMCNIQSRCPVRVPRCPATPRPRCAPGASSSAASVLPGSTADAPLHRRGEQVGSVRWLCWDGKLFVTYQVDREGEEGRWVVYRSDLRSKMEIVPPEGYVIHGPVGWLGDKIVMTGFRRGTSEQYTWAVEATCGIELHSPSLVPASSEGSKVKHPCPR